MPFQSIAKIFQVPPLSQFFFGGWPPSKAVFFFACLSLPRKKWTVPKSVLRSFIKNYPYTLLLSLHSISSSPGFISNFLFKSQTVCHWNNKLEKGFFMPHVDTRQRQANVQRFATQFTLFRSLAELLQGFFNNDVNRKLEILKSTYSLKMQV